ncbi:LysM peptidoglycan-binding domain-containing protein [Actinoplanes sp. LDG1-06]|uniref:LysM peptidoglycan-binding domain-containing protein n=1 Tax=Paractinoplanes ovalisporus TaxID=2810368 RepID=A0ABS2AET3_9ACTN|nr:LysM peptidoglycan-binding domain-containing protein [Actinoplanes ovalisporus]
MTRRGRAVILGLLVVLASLASAVLFTTASRADEPPAGPPPTIVVRSGDTLWDIASREMPRRDAWQAMDELRRLNGLSSYRVAEGDVLILPRGA